MQSNSETAVESASVIRIEDSVIRNTNREEKELKQMEIKLNITLELEGKKLKNIRVIARRHSPPESFSTADLIEPDRTPDRARPGPIGYPIGLDQARSHRLGFALDSWPLGYVQE